MRTYYHVDRGRSLRAGLALSLKDGLSVFGQAYWFKITANPPRLDDDATRREHSLETLRRERFGNLPGSRMTALFAAATLEEALLFAERIEPRPMVPVPIFEVSHRARKAATVSGSTSSRRPIARRPITRRIGAARRPIIGRQSVPVETRISKSFSNPRCR